MIERICLLVLLGLAAPGLIAGSCKDNSPSWSFQWENDSFPTASRGGSDRYYTNGIRYSRFQVASETSGLLDWLLDRSFSFDQGARDACQLQGWRIGHQLYTPQDLGLSDPDSNDRPYAALVYGGWVLERSASQSESSLAERLMRIEVQLGLVGPAAGGRVIQEEWHRLSFIDAQDPQGWGSQLPNEVVANLNLHYEQRMPLIIGRNGVQMDVLPYATAHLGSIATGLRVGASLRFGSSLYGFRYGEIAPTKMVTNALLSNQSAVNEVLENQGKTLSYTPKGRKWRWWFFATIEGYAVAHDIFLDGTIFSSSPSVKKKHFRRRTAFGFHAELYSLGLDISWNTVSKEFNTPPGSGIDRHEFLSIGLSKRIGNRM